MMAMTGAPPGGRAATVEMPVRAWSLWVRTPLLIAVVIATSVGCAGSESTPGNTPTDPYAVEYESAGDAYTSDFVRSVLSDHKVSDEELSEAQDSLVACLRGAGFEPLITTDGGRRTVNVPADADWSCVDQWLGPIEDLYWAQKVNPNNDNMDDLVAACLGRLKLVPDGFTGSDLEELEKQAQGSYALTQDGTRTDEVFPQNESPTLPSGMSIHAEETVACWTSPLTTGL